MKISTTVIEKKEIEKEIELPYFFKESNDYYKVISDKILLKVYISSDSEYVSVAKAPVSLFRSEIGKGTQISEADFQEHYAKAVLVFEEIA